VGGREWCSLAGGRERKKGGKRKKKSWWVFDFGGRCTEKKFPIPALLFWDEKRGKGGLELGGKKKTPSFMGREKTKIHSLYHKSKKKGRGERGKERKRNYLNLCWETFFILKETLEGGKSPSKKKKKKGIGEIAKKGFFN